MAEQHLDDKYFSNRAVLPNLFTTYLPSYLCKWSLYMQKAKTRQTNIILSHEKLNAQITVFHLLYAAVTYYKNTFVMKLCFYYYFLLIQLHISSTSNVTFLHALVVMVCFRSHSQNIQYHLISPYRCQKCPLMSTRLVSPLFSVNHLASIFILLPFCWLIFAILVSLIT